MGTAHEEKLAWGNSGPEKLLGQKTRRRKGGARKRSPESLYRRLRRRDAGQGMAGRSLRAVRTQRFPVALPRRV